MVRRSQPSFEFGLQYSSLAMPVILVGDILHESVVLFIEVKGNGSVAAIVVSKELLRFYFW